MSDNDLPPIDDVAFKVLSAYENRLDFTDLGLIQTMLEEAITNDRDARSAGVLEGATQQPADGVKVASAGEFAAIWNAMSQDQREQAVSILMKAQDEASKCFMEDHAGMKAQWEKYNHARAQRTCKECHAPLEVNTLRVSSIEVFCPNAVCNEFCKSFWIDR